MSAVAVDYTYRYVGSSHLDEPTGGLRLSTFSDGDETHPYFFQGHLVRPKRTADMLRALMHIVQARFHLPAAMLVRMVSLSDPVVTCSDERLRFEGFSGCCGVYVRIDILPPAVQGEAFGRGTTNVSASSKDSHRKLERSRSMPTTRPVLPAGRFPSTTLDFT